MTCRISIIQEDTRYCYVCGRYGTEIHHIYFGVGNRKLSEKYHCVVGLCPYHHRGNKGVHQNRELDLMLKKTAQEAFEAHYPNIDFLAVFGRNYVYND